MEIWKNLSWIWKNEWVAPAAAKVWSQFWKSREWWENNPLGSSFLQLIITILSLIYQVFSFLYYKPSSISMVQNKRKFHQNYEKLINIFFSACTVICSSQWLKVFGFSGGGGGEDFLFSYAHGYNTNKKLHVLVQFSRAVRTIHNPLCGLLGQCSWVRVFLTKYSWATKYKRAS